VTKVEAARIIEKFVKSQLALPDKYRDITGEEELALRKAVKALRREKMNENHP
jgi:hypothetical protein